MISGYAANRATVLHDDLWIFHLRRHGQAPLLEEFHVFLHSPFRLIHAVFNGVADSCESLKSGEKNPKKSGSFVASIIKE